MTKYNALPQVEEIREIDYKMPSYEEFMKNYEVDDNLNYADLESSDIDYGYGPCENSNCSCRCSSCECICNNYANYRGGLTEKEARLVRAKGKTVKIGDNNVKIKGFQHLIHTFNDLTDKGSDPITKRNELWGGSASVSIGDGVSAHSIRSSAGVNAGVGGLIASGGVDYSVFKIDSGDGGDVRFFGGNVGGEIGVGPGGVVAGYSLGADLMSVEHEGLRINAGFDAGSGFSFGAGGVEAKVGGLGFSIGKKMGVSTPFGGVSVDLEEACVVQ